MFDLAPPSDHPAVHVTCDNSSLPLNSLRLYPRTAKPTCVNTKKQRITVGLFFVKINTLSFPFVSIGDIRTCFLTQAKEGEDPLQHRRRLQSPVQRRLQWGKIDLHVFHKKKKGDKTDLLQPVAEEEE